MDTLTDLERAILDLEQQWWTTPGGKEAAITAMGLTPTRYYQLLNRLLATERAIAYAAVTVNRLNRIRSAKPRRRALAALNLLQ
ncbi:DUF3263 domain-containing protein [Mycolicibacterium elephantis]|uniref:DUF3263 domain-containing protein n=1 Tax=Mycolicibacterium elephantis TaxID=81858 RepID=UPI0007E9CBE2|nr:DUF3263 domain-containing protein [Mycolicibacterium elephantis]OBB22128.1 hypothetical protein A5762_14615 [Mycolicibacterium elephantis]